MPEILQDCTTKDLERVKPLTNRLMLAFQAMQDEVTRELSLRDRMIVTTASLTQLSQVVERVSKKSSTPRFIRSIKHAVKVARAFGTGNLNKE
jgi:hypothetical protein